jgi:hypothetical protein
MRCRSMKARVIAKKIRDVGVKVAAGLIDIPRRQRRWHRQAARSCRSRSRHDLPLIDDVVADRWRRHCRLWLCGCEIVSCSSPHNTLPFG